MKLIEIAKITVRRNGKTSKELYSTVKETVKNAISNALFENIGDVVKCCTIFNDGGEDIVKFRILLEESFYNEHLGGMTKDELKREVGKWLNEITYTNYEGLSLVGSGKEFTSKLWCKINDIK